MGQNGAAEIPCESSHLGDRSSESRPKSVHSPFRKDLFRELAPTSWFDRLTMRGWGSQRQVLSVPNGVGTTPGHRLHLPAAHQTRGSSSSISRVTPSMTPGSRCSAASRRLLGLSTPHLARSQPGFSSCKGCRDCRASRHMPTGFARRTSSSLRNPSTREQRYFPRPCCLRSHEAGGLFGDQAVQTSTSSLRPFNARSWWKRISLQ